MALLPHSGIIRIFNGLAGCQHDVERCAIARRRFCPDDAAVVLGHFFTNCQPDARSFVFGAAVQAFEGREDCFGVAVFKADAVVFNLDVHIILCGV